MASKMNLITDLYQDTILDITNNSDNWTSFLSSASMNYKYSFSDQVLIYAQKPSARACADIDTWNKTLHRWVNKGAKGIALISDENGYPRLKYVFDVSDTNNRYGRSIALWSINKNYENDIIESLENKFGDLGNKDNLAQAIKSASDNMVQDNFSDYLEDLLSYKDYSLLEELDEKSIEVIFKRLLSNTVSYMIMNRCGINPTGYFEQDDFKDISNFNNMETVIRLGTATSDISEMGLREIYVTLKNLRIQEINKIRTFDNNNVKEYDISKSRDTAERSESYEDRISNDRGLRTSQSNIRGEDTNSTRKIRNDEIKISQRVQESTIPNISNEGHIDGTSSRDRIISRDESELSSGRNVTERERNRGNESERPNEVGRNDEQLQDISRGDSSEGTNLRLNIYTKDTENHYSYVVTDDKINQILSTTQHLKVQNQDIVKYFKDELDTNKRIDYLKKGFNLEYTGIMVNDEMYGYKIFDNGLLFWKGNFLSRDTESFVEWNEVVEHYDSMILLHQLYTRFEPIPTQTEQMSLIENDEINVRPELEFSQEFVDKYLQEKHIEHKYEIYEHFQSSLSTTDNIEFLKNLYGIGGSSHTVNGSGIGDSYDSKGITLARGYIKNRLEKTFSWSYIEKRIKTLIFDDRYLNNYEKDNYEKWLEDKENNYQSVIENNEELTEEKLYQYHLGDKVYIGFDEYEILAFDDENVRCYDNQYPLFNKEFSREEFDKKVKENPANDHLIVDEIIEVKENPKPEVMNDPNQELVDTEFVWDNRKYKIDKVDNQDVELRDITFESSAGLPIFRVEDINKIKEVLKENDKKKFAPSFTKKKSSKVNTFDIHPEVKTIDRNQFNITNEELGIGTPREKYARNIVAIKVLKKCEFENRFATPEEQEVLSKYIGWGGLSQAFDKNNSSWANEYLELKSLLDEDEYNNARESTLTAFYTPPIVIKNMYKVIKNMGFTTGNILEPSCGVGNFIGMLPEELNDSKMYGVELDSISGKIAQQLYQKSSIAVQGYERTNLPDTFFDIALGNVPFGDFKVLDKKYDKQKFLIHDYFFAKTLDKVRPGGVVAFITSKGTLDKDNPSVRKYIAQRADLLGAIRLPDNTFKNNAGTEVTADILFLQKRDSITDIMPDWIYLDRDENNITMNKYFVDNPEMILGNMEMKSTQYGFDSTCKAYEDRSLDTLLEEAISNIHAEIKEIDLEEIGEDEDLSIPADFNVRNFSYTLVDNKLYYRENSKMNPQELAVTTENRVRGLIEIRDCVRTLIDMQTEDYPDEEIVEQQLRLNSLYDKFNKKYGLINSRANSSAFSNDSSYFLLCSLEILDENRELLSKADMFTKRTIKPHTEIEKVDTANEALVVSISEKAKVDLEFMSSLTNKTTDELITELNGEIFKIPSEEKYVTADEYLSGNVREKLKIAELAYNSDPIYESNVKALKEIQPKDLSASEISVRLGATWIPSSDIQDFMFDLLSTSSYARYNIRVHYSELTGEWNIEGKSYDRANVKAHSTYGTGRINAYKIIEDTLNLKDVRIYDYVEDENGKKQQILNKKETAIAQAKQEQIKMSFDEWIWKDPSRRERLTKSYNEKFNSIRPREYDGSHISFGGINPEITLRQHQLNAIARILYGGNTLLAHEVGAGKTFEMVAAAMESKRLGLCNKSLLVVPNHIIEQFASEFLQLYPSANILVATKKDFETANRKKFCSRIATGDFDAVIIGHSQFEKIPMSIERQRIILQNQIEEVTEGLNELKRNRGENFSIKQLEKTKKSIQNRLEKLNDQSRKDDVVTFEELGVDRIFVDEAHYYKNLFLYTKMRNVGGIAQTEAQKSSDLFMKCRYLDEITGGKGVIFATGTPISNSMVELYTMQRYLQYHTLEVNKLQHFDAWASTFGETVTAIELAPEGTGYRAKTRFAKFYNLPELMNMFKEVADIKTSDMLNLPVPKANYTNIVIKPSEVQEKMVKDLAERAERVRNKMVDSSIDNMLKITNDGRKLALDQRLINEMLPDFEESKVATCANNVYNIWEKNTDKKSAQLVFCDLSTPKADGTFNVYSDLKNKLIENGISEQEIAFIHEADNEVKKKELFSKVRKGQVRILIGSTQKMGAGTNCQDRLIALHDLDCPWRPSDLIQRSGRIIRQGNMNPEVGIFRYVTEKTFDAYLYQLVENKQRFISQIMTSKTPVRSAEDIDETALSYAEIKALAAGNPLIIEKTDLDTQVAKLKLLKQSHLSQIYDIEDKVIKYYPNEIKRLELRVNNIKEDIAYLKDKTLMGEDVFNPMKINGIVYDDKKASGEKLIEVCKSMSNPAPISIGEYRGFKMELYFDTISKEYILNMKNNITYQVRLGNDVYGNITRIDNVLDGLEDKLKNCESMLEETNKQFENARIESKRPFPQEEELKIKSKRLDELNILLNMNQKDNEIVDGEPDEGDNPHHNNPEYTR